MFWTRPKNKFSLLDFTFRIISKIVLDLYKIKAIIYRSLNLVLINDSFSQKMWIKSNWIVEKIEITGQSWGYKITFNANSRVHSSSFFFISSYLGLIFCNSFSLLSISARSLTNSCSARSLDLLSPVTSSFKSLITNSSLKEEVETSFWTIFMKL